MADFFRSARFITGALTLLLGAALLIGALLYLPYAPAESRYQLALGAVLCSLGPLLALRARVGLAAYALVCALALAWSLRQAALDLWALLPRVLAPLLWGAVLFTLRHRIAPTHDPSGSPAAGVRHWRLRADRLLRGHN
jgi:glucose dehydrogenase